MWGNDRKPSGLIGKVAAVFGLCVAVGLGVAGYHVPASAQQPEASGEPIAYDHLANQETDPFLFLGRLVDVKFPRYSDYRFALQSFPDVQSCLTESGLSVEPPNLLYFDWKKPQGGNALEVCLFRVFASLATPEKIQKWLRRHKFRVSNMNRIRSKGFSPRFENDPIFSVSGSWSSEKYREFRSPSWLVKLLNFDAVQGFSVVVSFSESRKVVDVGVSVTTE